MKATAIRLLFIVAASLLLRLALMSLIHNPGISDPAHYYNLGRRLSQGHGFTIDYVWHYARMPVELVHAIDHWMPLPGMAAALGMLAGGLDIRAALTLFLLAGALAPVLAFAAAKDLDQSDNCALSAAALAACLPELTLNSLRADTTILNMLLICSGYLLARRGMRSGGWPAMLLGGLAFGLAHLTRNDSLMLVGLLVACLLLEARLGGQRGRRWQILLLVVAFAFTIAPWHLRNLIEIGSLGSPQMSRMPFMVEPRDLYAYGMTISFETMLERQTASELLGKRVFELGAALKQMAISLQLPLALLVPLGLHRLISGSQRDQLRQLLPLLIWIAAILLIYPVLMPVHNQGGSFKKLFISILPLIIPLGAMALHWLAPGPRWRLAILLLSLAWLAWSSYALVQRESAAADKFYASMRILVERLEKLPDQTGDGQLLLMSQDPFVLSALGYSSVVTPLASREDTLALARRFEIDYLLMPAARPALDALYLGGESDPRFVLAAHIDEAGEIPFELYRFDHGAPVSH